MQGLENSMLKHFGVPPGTQGVLVADVLPDTPAARAGLAVGDVLLSINGKPAKSISSFRTQVALLGEGARAKLTRLRSGERDTVVVVLGELPEEAPAEVRAPTNTQERTRYGIQMAPLDRSFRNRLGIEDVELKGAVVVRVEPGSPAHQAGLEPGDVITHVDRTSVRSVEAVANALKPSDDGYLLRVWRRGSTTFKVLPPLKD